MTQETSGGAENTAPEMTPESVDAQLNEMRESEGPEKTNTPEPEQKQEPEKAEPPAERKTVPLEALHEARERLREERAARVQYEQRMQLLEHRLQQLANPAPPAPKRDDDPVAYFDHQIQNLSQVQQRTAQENEQLRQALYQREQMQQIRSTVAVAEQQFVAQTPDFLNAVQHVREQRQRELMAYGASPEQAQQQAVQEIEREAINVAAQGRNPAAVFYEIAKARGYTAAPPQQAPAEKLEAERRGVAAARTLGNGGQSAGKLTLEALASMSDTDFAKVKESDWRKAMGG